MSVRNVMHIVEIVYNNTKRKLPFILNERAFISFIGDRD